MTLEHRLNEIRELWPDLSWKEARLEECDHDVVLLDDRWVFRFPCTDPAHEPLAPEVRFLECIRDRVSVALPHYTRVAPDFQVAGYPMLPGDPLSLDTWDTLTPTQHEAAARQFAEVLTTIHSFPLEDTSALGMGPGKRIARTTHTRWLRRTQQIRSDGLTSEEMAYCDATFKALKRGKRKDHIHPSVIHGDFDPSHMLHDGTSLTGIIDFGDCGIGDPAIDLLQIWRYGESFFNTFFSHYAFASDALRHRSYRLWWVVAVWELEAAVRRKRPALWQRAYGLFPPEIADPARMDGNWLIASDP